MVPGGDAASDADGASEACVITLVLHELAAGARLLAGRRPDERRGSVRTWDPSRSSPCWPAAAPLSRGAHRAWPDNARRL